MAQVGSNDEKIRRSKFSLDSTFTILILKLFRLLNSCHEGSLSIIMQQTFLVDIYMSWINTCDKENLISIWKTCRNQIYPKWLRLCRSDRVAGASRRFLGALSEVWQNQCHNQSLVLLPKVVETEVNLTAAGAAYWNGSIPDIRDGQNCQQVAGSTDHQNQGQVDYESCLEKNEYQKLIMKAF